jgi:hypothetical protein
MMCDLEEPVHNTASTRDGGGVAAAAAVVVVAEPHDAGLRERERAGEMASIVTPA